VAVVQYTFTHKQYKEQHSRQKQYIEQHSSLIKEECGTCPVFARYTLAFALHLGEKHGKTSVRVAGECQLAKKVLNGYYVHSVVFMLVAVNNVQHELYI
jgi:hypothetical protein